MSFKQVILVRKDLKMSKGKISAQVAHASLSAALKVRSVKPKYFEMWNLQGQKKVVLQVKNEKEILEVNEKAKQKGLITAIIRDRGETEVPPNTLTCLAIGPDSEKKIDEVTGELKLL